MLKILDRSALVDDLWFGLGWVEKTAYGDFYTAGETPAFPGLLLLARCGEATDLPRRKCC